MSHPNTPPRYRAYLLRFWEERGQLPAELATWRFSLEDPHTGQRTGFGDLASLIAFLRLQMEGPVPTNHEGDSQ
jgi:hypothetical protein